MRRSGVQVLLSTYNGENYLQAQLDSLFSQDYPEVAVLVRDDGSTDQTLRLLDKYKELENVQIILGENLGVVKSFFALLESSSPEAAYFAFCDQDDVWEKAKLSRAIGMLEKYGEQIPVMYCSRVTLVDENLKTLGFSQIPRRGPAFGNALAENIATGCTIVINAAARDLILKRLPRFALIHDWWVYQVVSAFGQVIYDAESSILYRQHAGNLIGERSGFFAKWQKRAVRFLKRGEKLQVTLLAKEFHAIFAEDLPLEKKLILERFINERGSFWRRLRYSLRGETFRQSRIDDYIFRLLIILKRI